MSDAIKAALHLARRRQTEESVIMLEPPAYTEARLRSKYHVQVEIEHREIDRTPARVLVIARVGRVFRGGDLRVGDAVQFFVPVLRDGDDYPTGAELWMNYDDFQNAQVLEVFLDGNPPRCELALSQVYIVTALSDEPQVSVPTEEELKAEWDRFYSVAIQDEPSEVRPGLLRRFLKRVLGR